jgi:PKHD-type hydroxylase
VITRNIYGFVDNFLPDHVCSDIVSRASQFKPEEGIAGGSVNKKTRDSRVIWLTDHWIFDWITPAVHEINKGLGWNFNVLYPENIQFTKYRENQFYNWHQDSDIDTGLDIERKISVVIPLKNSDEYEGGNLEISDPFIAPESSKDKIIKKEDFRKKGSLIVFPSYTFHRVTKVTKGERLSIVIWYKGEKFK